MKLILSMAVLLSSSALWAATTSCPAGTKTVADCLSTPEKGDNEFAGQVLQGISICQKGSRALFVAIDSEGKKIQTEATVENRMGGTSYTVIDDTVEFSLSFTTGTRTPSNKAKFGVNFTEANLSGSSTYTCK